ncbi:aroma-sacti cluster domain-containing protein [Streptomyces sp. NPDC006285]|uniref:aroma-sacti cluster domain-containing protein n=1 Tax=Streptomyces sp. NPDC006285 TaxID=3364742 RepID=UPI0036BAFACA
MSERLEDPAAAGGPDDRGDDTLRALESHGFGLAALTDEQRQVLRELSVAELELVLDLKERLDEAGPEVQAHSEIAGGALF